MRLSISKTSGTAIYEQIARQIRAAILSGELASGQALPSLRETARRLHVSVLTVSKAYAQLAEEGLVRNVQGKGSFVMPRGNRIMRRSVERRIKGLLAQASGLAKDGGIGLLDLLGMLETSYDAAPAPPSGRAES
ncbi:MAG: GntR family transcriptional regulator [Bifidobacterium mongoliense]|jgi:GntR family transcriptional regulator|uniref:GntR family transcriptional regulator n=1 Tax=Bifidobacterium mongoliense TaxID=518643 RepID=UPI002F35EA0A